MATQTQTRTQTGNGALAAAAPPDISEYEDGVPLPPGCGGCLWFLGFIVVVVVGWHCSPF